MWKKLGALTVGQSPRPDLVHDILSLCPQTEIVHAGALDGLEPGDIPAASGHYPILTRLNSGQVVSVERDDLLPLLQNRVNELEETEVDAVLVMCTGDFSDLASRKPLIIPHEVFTGAIGWMRPEGRVGIICPVEGQRRAAEEKWRRAGLDPIVVIASPFSETDMRKAGCALQDVPLSMVILDCYGHGQRAKEELSSMVNCPILSMRSVVVGILAQFLR